ncbi:hypothetical protein V2W30_29250 [Streptomyces sp. Q6]|uniref:Uncharacterized protein n=1 Tax=Streptomyces citrinus TaxID=3118173 RepID=A0ACD5AIX2_9ACTN
MTENRSGRLRGSESLDDRVNAMAATDDRARRLFSGLTVLFAALLGLGSVVLLARGLSGAGPHYSGSQMVVAGVGVGVAGAALVVRARRDASWTLLGGACGACVAWLAVGAALGRM